MSRKCHGGGGGVEGGRNLHENECETVSEKSPGVGEAGGGIFMKAVSQYQIVKQRKSNKSNYPSKAP